MGKWIGGHGLQKKRVHDCGFRGGGPCRIRCRGAALLAIGLAVVVSGSAQPSASERERQVKRLIEGVREAFLSGQFSEALSRSEHALEIAPANPHVNLAAARLQEGLREFEQASALYSRAIELDPTLASAYNGLGTVCFQLQQVDRAVRNFREYLRMRPDQVPYHWKLGIALYYAGEYEEAAKQFLRHHAVEPNDVETAFWHWLCMMRWQGREPADKNLLKVERDPRVPMMELYRLLQGAGTELDVLNALHADAPPPEALKNRRCYAHLYLGLYAEAMGDPKESLAHLYKAANEFFVPHFIGDIARVHLALRNSPTPP